MIFFLIFSCYLVFKTINSIIYWAEIAHHWLYEMHIEKQDVRHLCIQLPIVHIVTTLVSIQVVKG